jgi:phenylacetate-CoA ligase
MGSRAYFSNPDLNSFSSDQIEEKIRLFQEGRLSMQLRYCYDHSPFYRRKFEEAGAKPEDIRTLDDLRALPVFMTKEVERKNAMESIQRDGHPFGTHLCAPVDEIYLTGTTSGTTGVPTFTYTFTKNDMELIGKALSHRFAYNGVGKGDRILFIFSLGIYATTMTLWGIRGLGALPIDMDARAGSELILRIADLTKPTYMATTPSLAEYLIQKAPFIIGKEVNVLKLKGLLLTGEIGVSIHEVKKRLEEAYGCRAYDYWAPAGHAIAITCDSDVYYGMHGLSPDLCTSFDDLIDPDSKRSVPPVDGAVGEMVITSLKREAAPLIKYAYGDIVQVSTKPCPNCGFPGKRIKIIGRSDDMLVVKGVNIYPSAIKQVISSFVPKVTGEMRIVLDHPPPRVIPPLKLKLEYGVETREPDLSGLANEINRALHDQCKIRPQIEWVPPGTLEKSTRKTPVFEKNYEKRS